VRNAKPNPGANTDSEKPTEHSSTNNSEAKWSDFKETVISVATETVGLKKSTIPHKPWITSQMTDSTNER